MQTIRDIEHIFADRHDLLSGVRNAAFEAKEIIETLSSHIESYTAAVCPGCTRVCCINKHSRYDRSDIIFMAALGNDIPDDRSGIEESAPCRFLGNKGCVMARSQRPYRCTWFFCTPLLDYAIEKSGPSGYRKFVGMLQQITEKRTRMMHDFEAITLRGNSP